MSDFIAVLDTNALFGFTVRGLLLKMATPQRLYQPYWSDQILAELDNVLRRKRPNVDFAALNDYMNESFPQARKNPPRRLVEGMANAVEDRHVLALGITVGAHVIVTDNTRDFEPHCKRFDIQAVTVDQFTVNQINLDGQKVSEAVDLLAQDYRRDRHWLVATLRERLPEAMQALDDWQLADTD